MRATAEGLTLRATAEGLTLRATAEGLTLRATAEDRRAVSHVDKHTPCQHTPLW